MTAKDIFVAERAQKRELRENFVLFVCLIDFIHNARPFIGLSGFLRIWRVQVLVAPGGRVRVLVASGCVL